MAITAKTFQDIPKKTAVGASDSFMVSSPEGEAVIPGASVQSFIRSTIGVCYQNSELGAKAGDWVRVASITSEFTNIACLLVLSTSYNNKVPVPLCCFIGGVCTGANVACTRLSPLGVSASGSGARPSFKAARFVKTSAGIYFEVQLDSAENLVNVSSLTNMVTTMVMTPEISDAKEEEVIKTFDLTE